jgi:hypothetical protein
VRDAIRELPGRRRRVIVRADFEERPAIGQLLFRARRNLQSSPATGV